MSQTKNVLKRMMHSTLLASVGFAALLYGASASLAQTAPPMGNAATFSVLAALSAASANMTTVCGDLGLSPGLAVSRTGPWTVGGTEYFGPLSLAANAQIDALGAYNNLLGQPSNGPWAASPWSPPPGVWTVAADATFTGTINLTGLYTDVWVFQVGRDMTFSGSVILGPNVDPCKVFWQIGRDATIAVGSTFVGTLIASRDITLVSGATVEGRIISLNGALTTDANTICLICAPPPIPPTLSKAFNPVSINAGGVSTLTITLSNPNVGVATLTAPLTDTLPPGVVIAPIPNASTTCGVGVVTAVAGGNTVTLTGASIPGGAPGFCTVTVDVTAAAVGNYTNTLAANALQTDQGNNAAPASATLPVATGAIEPTVIPTLSEWGVIIFMLLAGLMSIYYLRRQKVKA